jgi:hypothetical protein
MAEGTYVLSIGVTGVLDNNTTEFLTPDVLQFRVFDPLEGDSALGVHGGAFLGIVRPKLPWAHTDDQRITV